VPRASISARLARLSGSAASEFLDAPQAPEFGLGRDIADQQMNPVTGCCLHGNDSGGTAQHQSRGQHATQIGFPHATDPAPEIVGVAKRPASGARCGDSRCERRPDPAHALEFGGGRGIDINRRQRPLTGR